MSQGYTGPPQSSGGGGGTVLIVVLVVLGIFGLLCLGVCGLGMLGVGWGARQASTVANQAVAEFGQAMQQGFLQVQAQMAVEGSSEAKEKLGEPLSFSSVEDSPPAVGNSTTFDFEVTGSKGTGIVHVEGQLSGGEWKITALQVRLADGNTIDLDANQPFPSLPTGEAAPLVLPPEITDPPSTPDTPPIESMP